MKKLLLPTLFALVLSGCGSSTSISMDVQFTTSGNDDRAKLVLAAKHITERRLEQLESELSDFDVTYGEDATAVIAISGSDADAMQELLARMTEPFTVEIRLKTELHEEGDIAVEGLGSFRDIDIHKRDMKWVLSRAMEASPLNHGEIMIQFTEDGTEKMDALFSEHSGEGIGLFIRNQLAANFAINQDSFGGAITIPNVPSAELAQIFADDMNVGINMTFTQSQ
jgi:hypothetical protein